MNKDGSSVIKSTEKPFDFHRNQPSDQPNQIFNFFSLKVFCCCNFEYRFVRYIGAH